MLNKGLCFIDYIAKRKKKTLQAIEFPVNEITFIFLKPIC